MENGIGRPLSRPVLASLDLLVSFAFSPMSQVEVNHVLYLSSTANP